MFRCSSSSVYIQSHYCCERLLVNGFFFFLNVFSYFSLVVSSSQCPFSRERAEKKKKKKKKTETPSLTYNLFGLSFLWNRPAHGDMFSMPRSARHILYTDSSLIFCCALIAHFYFGSTSSRHFSRVCSVVATDIMRLYWIEHQPIYISDSPSLAWNRRYFTFFSSQKYLVNPIRS